MNLYKYCSRQNAQRTTSNTAKMFGKLFFALSVLAIASTHGFSVQPKIVNGAISNPADFPFFAYITYPAVRGDSCSATLLSDR